MRYESNHRVNALDGARVIAMLVIVLSHVSILSFYPTNGMLIRFFNNPTIGVDYFFMLSGYGIYELFTRNAKNTDFSGIRGGAALR